MSFLGRKKVVKSIWSRCNWYKSSTFQIYIDRRSRSCARSRNNLIGPCQCHVDQIEGRWQITVILTVLPVPWFKITSISREKIERVPFDISCIWSKSSKQSGLDRILRIYIAKSIDRDLLNPSEQIRNVEKYRSFSIYENMFLEFTGVIMFVIEHW